MHEQDRSEMNKIRIGLVGIGKIARDQHLPVLFRDARFELVATASRHGCFRDVPSFPDIATLIAEVPDLAAISICTPPSGRFDQAVAAIDAGLHVMLEKPPSATVDETAALLHRARDNDVTLFASWHSREAAGVEPARTWLAGKKIESVRIIWKEDIRRWHPGQNWILEPGGFGVFDPGINALSIATQLLPEELLLDSAWIEIPEGSASPLRAELQMRSGKAPVVAEFDFLKSGNQVWDIVVDTDVGLLTLSMGGRILKLPDGTEQHGADSEYSRLYDRFAELISSGRCDVDTRPLRLVTDALQIAERKCGDRFAF
jgi:D-galactose 1-dehydrogenase/L-arabinose 1- dehydrogenase